MHFSLSSKDKEKFVADKKHRVVIALGGRGSGKTHVAVVKTIGTVLEYPGSRVWFVAPDLERLEEGLLNKFRELCPPDLLAQQHLTKRLFVLANGSVIHWRSTDAVAGLRAGEQNFAVFDEAAWSTYGQAKRAFSDLIAGLRLTRKELIIPNKWLIERPWIEVLERGKTQSRIKVTYSQPNQLVITTTPAIGSFINDLLEGGDPDGMRTFPLKTSENLENLPEGYLDQLKEAYPGQLFQQEALGELIGVESANYPSFDRSKHVRYPPVDFKMVVGGIDWGWRNNLAIVVYGFSSSGVAWGLEEFVAPHITSDRLIQKCADLRDKYGILRFFCDPAEPRSIMDLNAHGIMASKAVTTDKLYRTTHVAARFEITPANTYRLYISPDMKETIRAFRFAGDTVEDPKKIKEVKSGRPGDDPLDASEYAILGGELLLGGSLPAEIGRGHKRHEGSRPSPVGVPFSYGDSQRWLG
jgi:phage terminase large subunit-like protein